MLEQKPHFCLAQKAHTGHFLGSLGFYRENGVRFACSPVGPTEQTGQTTLRGR